MNRRFRVLGAPLAFSLATALAFTACGNASDDGAPQTQDPQALENPLRRLSHFEYRNTLRDLLYLPDVPQGSLVADPKIEGYENFAQALSPSEVLIDQYSRFAREVAQTALEQSSQQILGCAGEIDRACLRAFVGQFGQRAFRRPLTRRELDLYQDFVTDELDEGVPGELVAQLAIQAMIQSPAFLYRIEDTNHESATAGQTATLSDWEIATRLSYLLWGTMPDETLFAAAAAGTLKTPQQRVDQAQRMLADPRSTDAMMEFARQWLDVDAIDEERIKDQGTYEIWSREIADHAKEEARRFLRDVFAGDDPDDGTLRAVLTSRTTWVNHSLGQIYGVDVPDDDTWYRVELNPAQRAGYLTSVAFLAGHAHQVRPSPVLRGVFLLERVLNCGAFPAPPADVSTSQPDNLPEATTNRQWFETVHAASDRCQGCHSAIDPFGFPFENYDAIGQWRDFDNGVPVDASAVLVNTDVNGDVQNAVEMVERLATSTTVMRCASKQLWRYAHGRKELPEDATTIENHAQAFIAASGRFEALLLDIVRADEFAQRVVAGQ